jgi:hypothetical protein
MYSNRTCDPILDIYVLRAFQWYNELFNLMNFDPCNCSLKIWKSIGTPIPRVGAHLGVCGFIPSHPPTFSGAWDVTPGLHFWPTPLQALALITSLKLGSWHMVLLDGVANVFGVIARIVRTYSPTWARAFVQHNRDTWAGVGFGIDSKHLR